MATAVVEQIATELRTRLGLIDTDSGYENTTAGVVRSTRLNESVRPKDYQIYLNQLEANHNQELSHPGNPPAVAWDQEFQIVGEVRPSEANTTALDTLKNQFWGDVVKSFTTTSDGSPWHTFGGVAINSRYSMVEDYEADDGADAAFMVMLTVTFRTDEDDPFTVRA